MRYSAWFSRLLLVNVTKFSRLRDYFTVQLYVHTIVKLAGHIDCKDTKVKLVDEKNSFNFYLLKVQFYVLFKEFKIIPTVYLDNYCT